MRLTRQALDLQLFAEGGDPNPPNNPTPSTQPFASFADEAAFRTRMEAETTVRLEALAKESGFGSYKDMQAAAKAKADADNAAKSELEKAKDAATAAEKKAADALAAANFRTIDAEIKLLAAAAGFVDTSDALALVDRAAVKVDDKGVVSGAKEAVEALAKAKPHLVGTQPQQPPQGGIGVFPRVPAGKPQPGDFGASLAQQAEQRRSIDDTRNSYFRR